MKLPAPLCRKLEKAARTAAKASYSPYSKFRVGAAILTGSGKVYTGANIENASYGLCNCAERTAIFTAAAAGERTVKAVAVYTPTRTATTPCGACRQVINEFGPTAPDPLCVRSAGPHRDHARPAASRRVRPQEPASPPEGLSGDGLGHFMKPAPLRPRIYPALKKSRTAATAWSRGTSCSVRSVRSRIFTTPFASSSSP